MDDQAGRRHAPLDDHAPAAAARGAHERPAPGARASVLDIGGATGALLLWTDASLAGAEVDIRRLGEDPPAVHTAIHPRQVNGRIRYAGLYPALPAGRYEILLAPPGSAGNPVVEVQGARVVEYDASDREAPAG